MASVVRGMAYFPVAVINIRTQRCLGRKGFISVYYWSQVIMEESQGGNLAGGTDAESEGTVPADLFSLPGAQSVFFQPRNTSRSGPSPATAIRKMWPPVTPTGQSDLDSSSVETPRD